MADKSSVIEDCELMIKTICDCAELNTEIETLTEELKIVSEMVSQCVNENARKKQSQEAYAKKYNSLVRRYERAEKRLKIATAERTEKINKEREIRLFITTLTEKESILDSFDEEIWIILVEKVEVFKDGKCTVYFKNGVTVDVTI